MDWNMRGRWRGETGSGMSRQSSFQFDLERENVMAEFMGFNYYAKLYNDDGSRIEYKRITEPEEQKAGVDVEYIRNGLKYIIDEKAQMDYIYNTEPLPTFALELLNSSSGALGWFINTQLKTQYYMFIWPHAERKPLTVDNIEYAYFTLINKEKLKIEVEKRFRKNSNDLLEYAKRLSQLRLEGVEAVNGYNGNRIGYKYKKNGFDNCGYLYYTLSKRERPVNLVVKRDWLAQIAEACGKITNDNEVSV